MNSNNLTKSKDIIVVMYRTYGIKNGRGYQPVNIFEGLSELGKLKFMLVFRKRRNETQDKRLIGLPFICLAIMWLIRKIYGIRGRVRTGAYLYYKVFFDKFVSIKLRKTTNSLVIFNYFPSKQLLSSLRKKMNKIYIYVGQLEPNYWMKQIAVEYKKKWSKTK